MILDTLHKACSLRRASGSATEAKFVAYLANRLPVTMIDEAGNVHVDLRTEPHHRTCFTAHTDTVHHGGGPNEYTVDGKFWRASGGVLGSDDGAGIALLMHMIEHRVPGYYIFFRGEEVGGIGSDWVAKNLSEVFDDIDRAVAFDRAGYSDVITHQAGGRCCSDEFAAALALQLTTEDFYLAFMPSGQGVFTDTANLTELVPECTNVSVGYFRQHSEQEHQDVEFLQRLAEQILTVKWDDLPVSRKVQTYNAPFYGTASYDEDLVYTIEGALKGRQEDLLYMMAEQVNPDLPDVALHYLRLPPKADLEVAFDSALAGEQTAYVLGYLCDSIGVF